MRRLNFTSNGYGTWFCEPYTIEFFQEAYHCFNNGVVFGPPFSELGGAVSFCQQDSVK